MTRENEDKQEVLRVDWRNLIWIVRILMYERLIPDLLNTFDIIHVKDFHQPPY